MDQREGASERRRDDLMIPTLSTDSSEEGVFLEASGVVDNA